jgi:dipeptidyl aminopeptidase/acylaminoacyl peptidase
MARRAITAEDLYRFIWVEDPQIAPDGQRIAFVRKDIDRETNEYRTAIWMTSVAEGLGAAYQFTGDGSSPRWSPDGRYLAFVSDRAGRLPEPREGEDAGKRDKRLGKGKGQIWVMPANGGEARQLTFQQWGASDPTWSPDGSQILYVAKTGDAPEIPEHNGKKEPRSHRITRLWYRLNGPGFIYERRSHLFVVAAEGGEARQLTDGDWDDGAPAWSPDGKRIIFDSDRREDRWYLPESQLWQINADGTGLRQLTKEGFNYYHGSWSPDGQQIACLGEPSWHGGGHTDVFVFRPGEEPRCLTTEHFVTFADSLGSDMRNDHADPTPVWSPDGQTLYVIGNARGAGNLYALSVAEGNLSTVTVGEHQITGFSFDDSRNAIALAASDVTNPGDLYIHWRDSSDTQRLTDVNATLLDELELSIPEEITFEGANGWNVEGWILKPRDFDPSRRYPLVLEIHGGPNTAYGYTFHHEFQTLAGKGYVVLYTNPRGSTSYGRDFSKAVQGIWGKEDYEDIMRGVDAVIARGYIDTDRLGVTGGSYGGFMTNWIIGHTDRFSAAVTLRSVTNLTSMFGTSDIGPWLSKDNWETTPWDDPQTHIFHSPITYVKNMTTPLLIIHSEEDWRCPIEQGEQLFMALTYLRREVEFLRFEGQNHDLSRSGHPRLRIEHMNAVVDWFTSHIPPGPAPEQPDAKASTAEREMAGAPRRDEE